MSFEASSAGTFVAATSPRVGPPLMPVAGKASGTLRVKDRTYALTTSYAVRKKIFYDEPEEMLCVLVGDKPLEGTDLLALLLQDSGPRLVQREGFHGLHLKVNQYGRICVEQALGAQPTSYGTGYGLIASKELRFEDGRVIGSAADRNRDGECEFSLTFDAPITAP